MIFLVQHFNLVFLDWNQLFRFYLLIINYKYNLIITFFIMNIHLYKIKIIYY